MKGSCFPTSARFDRIVRKKIIHDYAGHYNRPDVLRLVVEPAPSAPPVATSSEMESLSPIDSTGHLGETEVTPDPGSEAYR